MDNSVTTIPQKTQVFYTTFALLPVTGVRTGDLGYATDTLTLYRWSGAAWQAVSTPPATSTTKGSYTGNGTDNRAIVHGGATIPNIVLIYAYVEAPYLSFIFGETAVIMGGISANQYAVTIPNATNFYVGNAGNYTYSGNHNAIAYKWVAIF